MNRKEQRTAAFELLFEREFKTEELPEDIFAISTENRDIDTVQEKYIKNVFFGVVENQSEIDGYISEAAKGWKVSRLTKATRSVLRLCTYEMLYCKDIPTNVSLNEAVELAKKFDDPKAKAFVNGVLNAAAEALDKK